MQPLYALLDALRGGVRMVMRVIAKALNSVSGGRVSPNAVTLISLAAHIPIAWLIATHHNLWAALLLVIFGLFDALDGELARLQNKASNAGMLLDATTDRTKEVLLYIGAAYSFVALGRPHAAAWAVAACGGSLLVSYVKAKGETAMTGSGLSANQINRLFQDGLMRYEIRMAVFVLGLVSDRLILATGILAILAWATAVDRLMKISRKL